MTNKSDDDLEAVRTLVATLEPFEPRERERIIRWAREKLGMAPVGPGAAAAEFAAGTPSALATPAAPAATDGPRDIRSFVAQKQPKSDLQFAATIAYYYQFEAAPNERKDAISKEDFVDACRKVDRKRPAAPSQVLVNAYHAGLFDRGDRGVYRLNSVGENLVAMVLPEGAGGKAATTTAKRRGGSRAAGGRAATARAKRSK